MSAVMSVGQRPRSSEKWSEEDKSWGQGISSGKNASQKPQASARKCRKPLIDESVQADTNPREESLQKHQEEGNDSDNSSK
jgi:hypothetical protein